MNDSEKRRGEFRKNVALEELMDEINSDLSVTEKNLLEQDIKEYPVIFIMGAMRSGTTLLEQWLASSGEFSYPSNIISRFYKTPIIGSKIQKLLTDPKYNFRNEIIDFTSDISFESNNGKTRGALEPNEFWYFWRRFFPDDLRGYTSDELIKKTDIQVMRQELWGIAKVFEKPIALKGMICNYHIPFLNEAFPKALFICLSRNIDRHVQSVLAARKRQFGTYDEWYSFLIPEYDELIQISDSTIQVKKQIEYINNAITEGLHYVPEVKKIQVTYEEFCRNPENLYTIIRKKLELQGFIIKKEYVGKKEFTVR